MQLSQSTYCDYKMDKSDKIAAIFKDLKHL